MARGADRAAESRHVAEEIARALLVQFLELADLRLREQHAPTWQELRVVEKHEAGCHPRDQHRIVAAHRGGETVGLPGGVIGHRFSVFGRMRKTDN